MLKQSHSGAFNARWLSFEDVARSFIPVPQFLQLGHESHSVLLGPRGCGKTTLLKMLTRNALDAWDASGRAPRFHTKFSRPRYEAIYISSDVRWSYELANIPDTANLSSSLALQAQRVMVTINSLLNLMETTEAILGRANPSEPVIAKLFIRHWGIKDTLRSFSDIRSTLGRISGDIRGYLNSGDAAALSQSFRALPANFYGHALDAPLDAIRILSESLPLEIAPLSWALCYDELEIAPSWLRTELLESLRSTTQNVFLKLTWSPLLPSGLRTSPESAADFKSIRLWHSHVIDPRSFCEELARDFLEHRFPEEKPTPDEFFSRSILAAEGPEEPIDSYEKGSTEYETFKELASWDQSFERLLKLNEIDPLDPCAKSQEEKDQFFRKVKPVALLRVEFSTKEGARSRKRPAVYAGKEAIYAMSEGNPRTLRGLLNDFADLGDIEQNTGGRHLRVPYSDQAKILSTAGQRFLALIKASPFKPPTQPGLSQKQRDVTLFGFINMLGLYFRGQIYYRDFPLDPIGSFSVPPQTDEVTLAIIEQLLELGAIVYIGSSPQDVPIAIIGSRFRLSFMLAPIFKLALRTYSETSLVEIMTGDQGSQLQFEF